MAWIDKCRYKREEAVKILVDAEVSEVYFKEGLWNPYKLVDFEDAEYLIMNSEIGAHVFYESDKDMYYVSCPYASDEY